MDLLIGGLYFCAVSVIRNIKHFNPDAYLDISNNYNGHWIFFINIIIAVFTKTVKFLACGCTISGKCYTISSEIILGTTIVITVALHGFVAFHIFYRKYVRASNQVTPFSHPDDLVTFSPGSSALLVLAICLFVLMMVFQMLSVPLTTSSASFIQMINITAVSIYWTVSQDNLRHKAEKVAKQFLNSRQNTFIVVIT